MFFGYQLVILVITVRIFENHLANLVSSRVKYKAKNKNLILFIKLPISETERKFAILGMITIIKVDCSPTSLYKLLVSSSNCCIRQHLYCFI